MATQTYPFVPKSNAHLTPGDFWAIPLQDGSFACGRVLEIPESGDPGAKVSFHGALMDWHGNEPPTGDSIAGSKILEHANMHVLAITKIGGEVLGNRPLEKDNIIVEPTQAADSYNYIWLRANRIFLNVSLDGQSEPSTYDYARHDLRKIVLLAARPEEGILLSDLQMYEHATGDSIGKNIAATEGEEHPGFLFKPLEHLYPEIVSPAEFTDESAATYLKEVVWAATTEIQNGNVAKVHDLFAVLEIVFTDANQVTQRFGLSFLEDFQTVSINLKLSQHVIEPFILPRTKIWWDEIHRFWSAAKEWMETNPKANPKRVELLESVRKYL
ncbi:MAG: hypothetical protein JWM39_74 [Parcubacteria group bacterium]|nr:hypothetical protein [Parcubacteria group bacterium]